LAADADVGHHVRRLPQAGRWHQGHQHQRRSMSAPVLDVERWADVNAEKLGALVAAVGHQPALAGRLLMCMDLPVPEARALVCEGVLAASGDPATMSTLRALAPIVEHWLETSEAAATLGREEAEARVLLWACVVALGWARDPERLERDDG
jgi:hypothetical protein